MLTVCGKGLNLDITSRVTIFQSYLLADALTFSEGLRDCTLAIVGGLSLAVLDYKIIRL
jgi:hypothetical protein